MSKDIRIELPEAVKEIFKVIGEYGSTAYIVGGSVRDSIMVDQCMIGISVHQLQ